MRKILVALLSSSLVVVGAAHAAPGDPDNSFSDDGKVFFEFTGAGEFSPSIALQPDGKILVAGSVFDGSQSDFAVARFSATGDRDMTFGTGGFAMADVANNDYGYEIAVQPDGKFVIVGQTGGADYDIAGARFKRNGDLDTDFGDGGTFRARYGTGTTEHGMVVAIQGDGKIVVGANAGGATDQRFGILRYKANGTKDSDFGTNGKKAFDFPGIGNSFVNDMVIQPNGKIVLAGATYGGGVGDFALMRVKPNGQRDRDFGYRETDFGSDSDEAYGVGLQSTGKIVMGGYTDNSDPKLALSRYKTNGGLDTNFRSNGTVTTDLPSDSLRSYGLVVQPDDKIVLVGVSDDDAALARYTPRGRLDNTFGGDGIVLTDFGGTSDGLIDVSIGEDNKLYGAGFTSDGNDAVVSRHRTGL